MAFYQLRLFKRVTTPKPMLHVVDQYLIEADDDASAIAVAEKQKIPGFDDSDLAIMFSPGGEMLWRVDADA